MGKYELFQPMLVMRATDFEACKEILRSNVAAEKQLLVDVTTLDSRRKTSCVVFVSHRWLRPEAKVPHPDNNNAEKYKMICTALQILRRQMEDGHELFVWIDYFGIDQDDKDAKGRGIRSLPAYIEESDMLLTPIVENKNYTLTQVVEIKERMMHNGTTVAKLDLGPDALKKLTRLHHAEEIFSRGWIRLEEFLGSNIPVDDQRQYAWFHKKKSHRRDRPLMFVTPDMTGQSYMIILPQLSKSVLNLLNPLDKERSDLTNESDRAEISKIMNQVKFDLNAEDKYEGETNAKGQPHGKGVFQYANGNKYEGEFKNGVADGKGVFYYALGNRYEGSFKNNERHGLGVMYFASGDTYRGQYAAGRRNGKGLYVHSDNHEEPREYVNGVRQ